MFPRALRLNPYLLVTMTLWGMNFVAVKLILLEMTAGVAALVRFLLMWVILVLICRWQGISLKYPKNDAWRILMQGFLSMGLYMVLFVYGMNNSTAAEGAIILGTSPIFTLLFAVMAGQERFHLGSVPGILLAFGGVTLVALSGPAAPPGQVAQAKLIGNLLILAAAAVWAVSVVVSRPLVTRHHPLQMLTLSMLGAMPPMVLFAIFDPMQGSVLAVSALGWAMMIYFAVMAGVVGFALFYKGVQEAGGSGAMLYQYLVSPLAALFGWLLLGTPLSAWQLAGLIVVLAGVALANYSRRIHESRQELIAESGA